LVVETEQQLLDAIRSGERSALRRLYERYVGYAMAIGLRYIPQRDQVEDVVQDSFVKIITSIGDFRYKGEGSLSSWVSRIVANMAIDYVRKNERVSFVSTVPDAPEEPPERDDDGPPIERIPPGALAEMIAKLPPGYRLVLNLHVFEQCTHKEIAQRLGIKEKSSASQLSRARVLLTEMMENYIKKNKI